VEEIVSRGAHALFFPCGLGHMMGLDTHDMEDLGEDHVGYTKDIARDKLFGLRSLRLAKKLETGHVLTVEPGIYFIPELIDRWKSEKRHAQFIDYAAVEKYCNFGGIRIEDDILVEKSGGRILGPTIPKTIGDIEDILS
jgi:Xaa-Pro aminopeptidase